MLSPSAALLLQRCPAAAGWRRLGGGLSKGAAPAHPPPAPARTITRAGLFDNLFPSGGGKAQQAPPPEDLLATPSGAEAAAAEEGIEVGEEEEGGGKFVQLDPQSEGGLDGSSEEPFGPMALLMVGFLEAEFRALEGLLAEMEADMVKLIPASAAMLAGSLGEALEVEAPPTYAAPAPDTPRVVFLSGMYAAEVFEVIAAYRGLGLPEAVFAAAVPRSWGRPLGELVEDVYDDHRSMAERRRLLAEQEAAAAAGAEEGSS